MRGFKSAAAAGRFCRAHDDLRDFVRFRSHHRQHIPSDQRRLRFLRRAVTALGPLEAT